MATQTLHFALGAQIAQIFRSDIVAGTLQPGQRLVEHELSQRFGVSRGPIRDALRELETEGLVEITRGKASVIGLTPQDIDELYSLRFVLETFALKNIFPCRDAIDWHPSEQAITDMQAATDSHDPHAFAVADLRFHQLLYEASNHRRLVSAWNQMLPTLEALLEFNAQHRALQPTVEQHYILLDALRTAGIDEAVQQLDAHLEQARTRIHASRIAASAPAESTPTRARRSTLLQQNPPAKSRTAPARGGPRHLNSLPTDRRRAPRQTAPSKKHSS